MKVRDFVRILEANGFTFKRQSASHRHYEGFIDGKRRMVTVDGTDGDEIMTINLASMKRQSAPPKEALQIASRLSRYLAPKLPSYSKTNIP